MCMPPDMRGDFPGNLRPIRHVSDHVLNRPYSHPKRAIEPEVRLNRWSDAIAHRDDATV
jgi:hypothetical protein